MTSLRDGHRLLGETTGISKKVVSREVVVTSSLVKLLVRVSRFWLHLHLVVSVLSVLLHACGGSAHVAAVAVDARVACSAEVLLSVVVR